MAAPLPAFASLDSATRKGAPVASGPLAYFPDALTLVAVLCRLGNDKHSPGQPLHWAKEKSSDELDALARYLLDELKGAPIDPEVAELGEFAHAVQIAWRALAHLQRRCDAWREAYADRVTASDRS